MTIFHSPRNDGPIKAVVATVSYRKARVRPVQRPALSDDDPLARSPVGLRTQGLTACTTPYPRTTLPKTTCLPSSHGAAAVKMRNCEPLLSGPRFDIESTPGPACRSSKLSSDAPGIERGRVTRARRAATLRARAPIARADRRAHPQTAPRRKIPRARRPRTRIPGPRGGRPSPCTAAAPAARRCTARGRSAHNERERRAMRTGARPRRTRRGRRRARLRSLRHDVLAQQHHHAAERRAVGLEVEKDPRVGAPPRP